MYGALKLLDNDPYSTASERCRRAVTFFLHPAFDGRFVLEMAPCLDLDGETARDIIKRTVKWWKRAMFCMHGWVYRLVIELVKANGGFLAWYVGLLDMMEIC